MVEAAGEGGSSPKGKPVYLRDSEADMRVVEIKRETARQIIALTASSALLLLVVAPFIELAFLKDLKFEDLKETLHILIPPTIGLFGAVAGFYFGERNMG